MAAAKGPLASKTISINSALAALLVLWPGSADWIAHHPRGCLIALCAANILLRFVTHGRIQIEVPLMRKTLGILAIFLLTPSCAPMPVQTLDQNKFYKRDMKLTVDGIAREGVLVAPRAASHSFDIEARGKLDLFTMESCHREVSIEDAGDKGWFADRRHSHVDYRPVPGMEDTGSCVVRFGGYEQSGGRHSWAIIDFEDAETTLPAQMKCNGENYGSNGVTICQSKQGLLQQIQFPTPVVVTPTAACPLPPAADGKTFLFPMPARECVFNFLEVVRPGTPARQHRLTTIGYESILIRGGN